MLNCLRALCAAALLALVPPAAAIAQPISQLQVRDANALIKNQAVYNDGTQIWPVHLCYGWTGTTLKACAVDANGNLGIQDAGGSLTVDTGVPGQFAITSSALPAGAATSALQTAANSSLASLTTALSNGSLSVICASGCSSVSGTIATPTNGQVTQVGQTANAQDLVWDGVNSLWRFAAGDASGRQYQEAFGLDSTGAAHPLRTDSLGALAPAQATPTTTAVTALTVNTATSLVAASTTRIGERIRLETASTVPLYICWTQTTSCSATVHDDIIPSGSAIGTGFSVPYGYTGAIYAFSTAAVSVSVTTEQPK